MKFEALGIDGVWRISPERHGDERGWFTRVYCEEEFALHGLTTRFPQHSMSLSKEKGTLRGMHFQKSLHAETKLVSCMQGAIFDVVVDNRPESPTYLKWLGVELSADNGAQLLIPEGCAHGFQTLSENALVRYMISTPYAPDFASGLRFDDPAIGIQWPAEPAVLSERDQNWPLITTLQETA